MNQRLSTSMRTLVRASWEATSQVRPRFFAFLILFVLAYSLDLLVPWAIGYILGVFVQHGFTPLAYELCLYGVGAYIGLRLAYTFCHHYGRYLQNIVAFHVRMRTLSRMFETFLGFPLRWHVNHHSGENLSKLHRSVGAIDAVIGNYIWQIVEGVVKFAFASIALFALDLWVALNVLAMGVVTVLVMILFNKKLTGNIRANNTFYDTLNRTCVDYLFNIVTVKTLRLEKGAQSYLRSHQPQGLGISKRISLFTELKWGSVGFGYAVVLGTSLLIYFYGHEGFKGPFDVAQVYVLMNYLDKIFQAIGSFTGYYSGLVESATAYEDADKILRESTQHSAPARTLLPLASWHSMQVRDLEFRYPGTETAGLRGMHFEFARGDKIALVGPSGGGKSTLLKILAGMLSPERVSITLDSNTPVTLENVAATTLLLPQEPEIFSETVRYNLTMGESFPPEAITFFSSLCKIEGIIEKLPRGWDSDLAEKGLNLSVGEKQRVAMARGLLRASSKDLILLDEPTSSLDPMTEKAIFHGILHHFADRTVITACHRLALVPLFDKIVFVRHGQIEEVGSFKELLDRRGPFAIAWEDYERKIVKDQGEYVS